MKLLLNPASEAQWNTHEESGARFKIRSINPAMHEEVRRKSLRSDGTLDISKWGGNYAVAAIEDWDGIGDSGSTAECNDANRQTFGRNQALNIMSWVVDKATSLDQYRVNEETAAKNA
jgi:hypothetical protein